MFLVLFGLDIASARFHEWFESRTHFHQFIDAVYLNHAPNALVAPYAQLSVMLGSTLASWIGLLGMPIVVLGPWAMLYFFTLIRDWRRNTVFPIDGIFPAALLVAYLSAVVFTPLPSNGDMTEFKERPFVLVYAVILLWSVARLRGSSMTKSPVTPRVEVTAVAVTMAFLVAVAAAMPSYDPQTTRLGWAAKHVEQRFPDGLMAAAEFVRAHARHGDTLISIDAEQTDSVALASLTGVPQYLAEGGVQWSRKDRSAHSVANERQAVLHELAIATSRQRVNELLAEAGVRWLVIVQPTTSEPEALASMAPDFRQGRTAVFTFEHKETAGS
jgi:hypothetical protein